MRANLASNTTVMSTLRPRIESYGLTCAAVMAITAAVMAQDGVGRPSFDVASVKPSSDSDRPIIVRPEPGGRFVMVNGIVSFLIGFAYVPGQSDVVGLPEWVKDSRYDVIAKARGDVPVADLRLMMQALLADRFKFRVHREMREQSAYRLTFARADRTLGPNLHRLEVDCDAVAAALKNGALIDDIKSAPNGVPHCRTTSTVAFVGAMKITTLKSGGTQLFALAAALRNNAIDRPIIDETGLAGFYEYTLAYGAQLDGLTSSAVGDAPSVFTAVQEQLGLKLEPVRRPLEVLVVDSIERPSPD